MSPSQYLRGNKHQKLIKFHHVSFC